MANKIFDGLQLLRNLVEPEDSQNVTPSEQAVLNVLGVLYEDLTGDSYQAVFDAVAKAYAVEYDFG